MNGRILPIKGHDHSVVQAKEWLSKMKNSKRRALSASDEECEEGCELLDCLLMSKSMAIKP